jgi:hypothetical protein
MKPIGGGKIGVAGVVCLGLAALYITATQTAPEAASGLLLMGLVGLGGMFFLSKNARNKGNWLGFR